MGKTQINLEFWQSQFLAHILNVDQNFAHIIQPMPGLTAESCANIYRRGYKSRLTEVLGDTFEATWWVLGDEMFLEFAGEYIFNIPSRSYDLSDYGNDFPSYLDSKTISQEIPFLSDLARFEWLFKIVFHEPDVISDEENISVRLSINPDLKIKIKNQVHFFSSEYLVYDIWKKRSTEISKLSEINWQQSQYLILFKYNNQVHSVLLSESEFNLLTCFCVSVSLEESVAEYTKKFGEFNPEIMQSLFSRIASFGILLGSD